MNTTVAHSFKKLPGHVLIENFVAPYYPADLHDVSKRTRIPYIRLHNLIRGQDRIDNVMAKAFGDFFGTGSDYWLKLQEAFDNGEAL